MSDREQNKRINQLRRQLANAAERIKTLELDMEPDGRIIEAFAAIENHMDEQFEIVNTRFDRLDSRFDRLEHQFNRLQAKMEVILEAITGLGDLPEDETN
jgi:chaperonin cofactor prefoldin